MNTPADVISKARAAAKALENIVTPEDLAAVATSGDYSDLTGTPTLGTAAAQDQAAAVADSSGAADVATLEAKVNELLGSLRASGLLAT